MSYSKCLQAFKFVQNFITFHINNFAKITNIGNRVSFPPNGKSFGIESSPFQRCYTKSGLDNNTTKDLAQTRSSIKNFDMSSPLRLLRRSCPQSPRVPSSQSAIQQGKSFDPVNLIKGKILLLKYTCISYLTIFHSIQFSICHPSCPSKTI